MGALQAPKFFPSQGPIMNSQEQQNVLAPSQQLPNQPLNPNLLPLPQTPQYAAPNATPAPVNPGVNNDPNARYLPKYGVPGGFGGGFNSGLMRGGFRGFGQ